MLTIDDPRYGQHEFQILDDGRRAVRLSFNPSKMENVDRLKLLAAAFISEINDQVMHNAPSPEAAREYAIARTHMQTAPCSEFLEGFLDKCKSRIYLVC